MCLCLSKEYALLLYPYSITVLYVGSLKGLKKEGTRGEGRQGKIGDEIVYDQEIVGMTFH